MSLKHPVFWALAGVILCALTATMVLAFWPLPSPLLSQSSSVPRSYAEAVGLLEESLGSEPGIGEGCDTQWLLHGHATGKVYVLLHGLSSCPGQFAEFAKLLHRRGDNVLMPRSPGHGLKNRMNTVVSGVTTDALIGSALRAVDLAHGLGRDVVLIGFSMNGATAAWLAQNRNDLSQVVLLNPFFSAEGLPVWAAGPVGGLLTRLPNRFLWWDAVHREALAGPPYAYPRFPTRVIGRILCLGQAVRQAAKRSPFLSGSVLVVTSACDHSAGRPATEVLVKEWRAFRPAAVKSYEFPAEEGVPHDFMDPNQPDQKIGLVYPRLLGLLR